MLRCRMCHGLTTHPHRRLALQDALFTLASHKLSELLGLCSTGLRSIRDIRSCTGAQSPNVPGHRPRLVILGRHSLQALAAHTKDVDDTAMWRFSTIEIVHWAAAYLCREVVGVVGVHVKQRRPWGGVTAGQQAGRGISRCRIGDRQYMKHRGNALPLRQSKGRC